MSAATRPPPESGDPLVRDAVRRVVGREILRRLRRMADDEAALEARKARWALRLSVFFLLLAAASVAWIALR